MRHKTNEKGARPGAPLQETIKDLHAFDEDDNTLLPLSFQVLQIARQFRLTPEKAKLICELAHIGGNCK